MEMSLLLRIYCFLLLEMVSHASINECDPGDFLFKVFDLADATHGSF